jgi:hypothetical protein
MTGYAHPAYAESLREVGTPRLLVESRGSILERRIPHTPYRDATGCYPLFACENWGGLAADLERLSRGDLVTLSIVADPFGGYDIDLLRQCFEIVRPFKEHFIVDLQPPLHRSISAHHRRNVRKALRLVDVERCRVPAAHVEECVELYDVLIARHGIRGIAAFSHDAFAKQLRLPGVIMFRAVQGGLTVGMTLWFVQGGIAYYHLGASTERGYHLRASFALFWRALEWFAESGITAATLGGAPGLNGAGHGLSRFKRGWSTGTRPVYLCGRVFDAARYSALVGGRRAAGSTFFPGYRAADV